MPHRLVREQRRNINNLIDALASDNLIHVLAEPNLVAICGETASFLVGGEFPIPVSQENGSISVSFKQFGISLAFVPTVVTEDRIRLHVAPGGQPAFDHRCGHHRGSIGGPSINIPALTVRRADTTVELGSGQSFAIAGLLQDTTNANRERAAGPWRSASPGRAVPLRTRSCARRPSW